MQTRRFAASVEGFYSSLAQSAGELWCCQVMVKKWVTPVLRVKNNSAPKVLRSCIDVTLQDYVSMKLSRRSVISKPEKQKASTPSCVLHMHTPETKLQ